jgi:uncharacterized membrane protein YgdD (TMEM256/DUF423 family)
MDRRMAIVGSFLGLTAIILGAFGAHALKVRLSVEQLSSFETGVKYQMYHALFLLVLSFNSHCTEKLKKTLFYLIVSGVLLFSGSIYLLSTRVISGFELKFLGPITPIGGLLLIIAWIFLFMHFIKKKI